jgi:hypothetical protein
VGGDIMFDLSSVAATIQADYIINRVNKLECSNDEKIKIIDAIIAEVKLASINELDKAI